MSVHIEEQATMKNFVVFIAVAVICWVGVTARPATEKYTTKFDNVDVDNVIKNERLLNGYVKCLLNKGTCTPDGAELKKLLPDALKTECSKCSEKQKTNSRKVLTYLIDNKQTVWSDLEKVYDPSGDFKRKYCELAKKEGTHVKGCVA